MKFYKVIVLGLLNVSMAPYAMSEEAVQAPVESEYEKFMNSLDERTRDALDRAFGDMDYYYKENEFNGDLMELSNPKKSVHHLSPEQTQHEELTQESVRKMVLETSEAQVQKSIQQTAESLSLDTNALGVALGLLNPQVSLGLSSSQVSDSAKDYPLHPYSMVESKIKEEAPKSKESVQAK